MLLLSIGIHGLLLFAPMPTKKAELTQKDQIQNKVKITQLPISSNPQRAIKNLPIGQLHRQLFYTKFGADKNRFLEMEQKSNTIGTIRLILNQLPEKVFNTVFAPTLKTSNFEINPQKKYGGGMVYEVKQGNFVTYLNLVPTSDRQSTIVVSWSSIP